ncbi:MAG: hypothetical protein LBO65_06595 [Spirochaetaceae bacterium]|jgi:hypothetical protein|nr:hypothetical protein [Spirochaetaceae bacterium]
MKKLVIFLLFLFVAGGAVFFLGWAQFDVPPGSWGVLRSKTHGIDPGVIREGRFRWVWYKLIPRNVSTAVFTIPGMTIPVEFSGTLPSGEVYSAMAGLKTDFSYQITAAVNCRLRGESLPVLAERENLLVQGDLDRYVTKLSGEIKNHLRILLWTYGENEGALKESQTTGTIRALESDLGRAFPNLEDISCTVKTLRFPDFVLYEEVRRLYRDYLAAQRGSLQGEIALLAVQAIEERRRLEELAKYGELLTKYPLLLQYLALERGIPPGNSPGLVPPSQPAPGGTP